MRLVPRPPEIGPNDGFTPKNDIFGYREFGERLGSLVAGIDQPLTLLLDGPWGSGKSTFVKQWAGYMRNRGAAVVEFNAFANDHQDDAFIVLAAEIIALAKEHLGGNESRVRKLVNSAKKAGARLLPLATRLAIRASTMGLLSVDDIEAAGETVKEFAKELGDEAAKAAEQAVSDRIRNARNDHAAMATFRQSLKDVSDAIRAKASDSGQPPFPLVFIIDELDRCRPPFALEIFERVKHLMSVPGVVFLFVTNLDQMAAAVRGAYGQSTNGEQYLEKFYDHRIMLPMSEIYRQSQRKKYIDYLWLEIIPLQTEPRFNQLLREQVLSVCEKHDVPLRTTERIITNLALILSANGGFKLAPIVAGLASMRQISPPLYEKARRSQLTIEDIDPFFGFSELSPQARDTDRARNWWRYCLDPSMNDADADKYTNSMFDYSVERDEIVSRCTEKIDNFMIG